MVRNAIFRLVHLNVLVMKVVSFPMCVNVAHLFAVVCVDGWCFFGLELAVFQFWIGKELLCIMFSSCLYLHTCRLYVFNLLQRNLTVAYLC